MRNRLVSSTSSNGTVKSSSGGVQRMDAEAPWTPRPRFPCSGLCASAEAPWAPWIRFPCSGPRIRRSTEDPSARFPWSGPRIRRSTEAPEARFPWSGPRIDALLGHTDPNNTDTGAQHTALSLCGPLYRFHVFQGL